MQDQSKIKDKKAGI